MNASDQLFLDADPSEAIELPGPEAVALARNPFDELTAPDPFLERIDSVPDRLPSARVAPPAEVLRPVVARRPRPALPPARARRRRLAAPRISEIELPGRPGWLDRWFSEDERRRLAALDHLVESSGDYDRFGLSPGALRRAFPLFYALYRAYFRVQSQGHEHIPSDGPVILAANHGGLLPFDGAMGVVDVLLHTDPPRLPRAIVEKWAGTLPWVNVFFARMGQVIGTRENFADLLDEGQAVLVFPEGVAGIRKPITQRYRLQSFHVGFIEQALHARAPVVPVAFLGTDDQMPILYDVKPLARRLGLPAAPITPTFPWLGPLGLLPYPVRYRIVYGEALRFHERFGPEAAEDAHLVRYLANQVRRSVQQLVDRHRS